MNLRKCLNTFSEFPDYSGKGADMLPPIEYYKPVVPNNFPVNTQKGHIKLYAVDDDGKLVRVLGEPYDMKVED